MLYGLLTLSGLILGRPGAMYVMLYGLLTLSGLILFVILDFGKTGSTAREVRITPPVKILPSPAGTSGGRRRVAATAGAGAGGAAAGGSTVRQRFIIHSV